MVGTGPGHTALILIPLNSVTVNTSFGAYANKFLLDIRDGGAIHGTRLHEREILELKKSWHKLYAHFLQQIDARFPPENMQYFKHMQVLDPSVVYGSLRR
jgi:hypothetical protein